jgi:hypothetical protein
MVIDDYSLGDTLKQLSDNDYLRPLDIALDTLNIIKYSYDEA